MNIAATKSSRPNKAQLNAGPKLKVQQLVIPEVKRLQQQELQAQQLLTINKPVKQIPRQATKPTAEPKQKNAAKRLEVSHKQPTGKAQAKPKKSTQQNKVKTKVKQLPIEAKKEQSLEQQKKEMVEWLENVQ